MLSTPLTPRTSGTRSSCPLPTIYTLDEIKQHFDDNISTIESILSLTDSSTSLSLSQKEEIWRSLIVNLVSSLDFYMHELSKYRLEIMHNNETERTSQFNKLPISMRLCEQAIIDAHHSPSTKDWLKEYVCEVFDSKVIQRYNVIKSHLDLLNISFPASPPMPSNAEKILEDLCDRRNAIAHQADCTMQNANKTPIDKHFVETNLIFLKNFVNAIQKAATPVTSTP